MVSKDIIILGKGLAKTHGNGLLTAVKMAGCAYITVQDRFHQALFEIANTKHCLIQITQNIN
jgi:hypothetical protein